MSDDIICVIYARTACDTLQRAGVIEQSRLCQEFITKKKGWTLVKEYFDSGVSGNEIDKPALGQLLSDMKKGGIDKVVMTDVTRLHRGDMADYSDYFVKEFERRGAEVVFVKHVRPEDGAAASNIIRTIKRAMIAQMECIMPDITMCENAACPLRQQCYRFMAKPDAWQSVACFAPLSDTQCDHFMALKHEKFWRGDDDIEK
jgi:DNA invertase Pin-like site-specific DNA recombinase